MIFFNAFSGLACGLLEAPESPESVQTNRMRILCKRLFDASCEILEDPGIASSIKVGCGN